MQKPAGTECVVLFHGLSRTCKSMRPLERFLEKEGYVLYNMNYPSLKFSFRDLIRYIDENLIDKSLLKIYTKLHFVGHSMGGLLIRSLLNRYTFPNLGRVVMLGTPNHGSEVANFISRFGFFRWLFGPCGTQLVQGLPQLQAYLGPICFELGIIADSKTTGPWGSWLIDKDNDGRVSVESTRIKGMKDHIIIPTTHTRMLKDKRVMNQVLCFLKTGAFRH